MGPSLLLCCETMTLHASNYWINLQSIKTTLVWQGFFLQITGAPIRWVTCHGKTYISQRPLSQKHIKKAGYIRSSLILTLSKRKCAGVRIHSTGYQNSTFPVALSWGAATQFSKEKVERISTVMMSYSALTRHQQQGMKNTLDPVLPFASKTPNER